MVTEHNFTDGNYITFLEHVVLTMSLTIKNRGTRYSYDDYNTEYYQTEDFDALYEWLSDSHPRRGDINIELASPQGTKSVLLPYRDYDFINDEGYDNWPFMSVHYWGENPLGTWTLTITYRNDAGYVHMSGHNITFYGVSSTPTAVNTIPQHCHPYCDGGCSAEGPSNCDSCNNFRLASTLECVDECASGTVVYKSYCVSKSPVLSPSAHQPSPNRSIQFDSVHTSSSSMDMIDHQTIPPLIHSSQYIKTSFQHPQGTTHVSMKHSEHTPFTYVPILKSSKPHDFSKLTSTSEISSKLTIVQDMNMSLSIVTTSSNFAKITDNNKKKIVVAISSTAAVLLCIIFLVGASIVGTVFITRRKKKKGKFTRLNSEGQDQIDLIET